MSDVANTVVCNYAILRFLPYPETGELVNLGVVVHCAAAGLLDFRLETARTKRVTDFFPELSRENFRQARAAIRTELERVRDAAADARSPQLGRDLFRELVRPRETVFRFGEIRTVLTRDPHDLARQLFERYVERQFAQDREYQESVMADRYLAALRQFRPERCFVRDRPVGSDEYRVRLPIVSQQSDEQETPRAAIKPLDLLRPEPTAIIEHGDAWIQRVRRLEQIGRLPERFIFAVRSPGEGAGGKAARRVLEDLREQRVHVVEADDENRIVSLAADWDPVAQPTGELLPLA